MALLNMLKYCYELGTKYVTVYAFSIDNFKRRPEEVESTMKLMKEKIEELIKEESLINLFGIKILFLGNLQLLSESVKLAAEKAMAKTAKNSNATLSICVAYTCTDEIVHSVEECCKQKKMDKNKNGEINVKDIERNMYTTIVANPDIIIRTSGETRLSNFLMWQSENCLLYCPRVLWPEIGFWHLVWAVLEFQRNFRHLKKEIIRKESSSSSWRVVLWWKSFMGEKVVKNYIFWSVGMVIVFKLYYLIGAKLFFSIVVVFLGMLYFFLYREIWSIVKGN